MLYISVLAQIQMLLCKGYKHIYDNNKILENYEEEGSGKDTLDNKPEARKCIS